MSRCLNHPGDWRYKIRRVTPGAPSNTYQSPESEIRRCHRGGAAVRGNDLPFVVPAVPRAADHREADPAVVRRLRGGVGDLPGVLPERAPRGLCLRGLDHPPRAETPGPRARRPARRVARVPAHPRLERLEAAGERAADRAHPASPGGDLRTAVFPALHHHAAAPGVVLASVPERRALPTVRALQPRIAARAPRLSAAPRARFRPRTARVELVAPLCRVRGALRSPRVDLGRRGGSAAAGRGGERVAALDLLPRRAG